MESQFQITVAPKGKGRKFLLLRKRSLEKTPNRVTSVPVGPTYLLLSYKACLNSEPK